MPLIVGKSQCKRILKLQRTHSVCLQPTDFYNHLSLSAVIITHNEAHNIERCIRSLEGLADEVIVVDSFSTDGTAELAESLGAKVFQRAFNGYGEQKAFAVSCTGNRWVLNADADEEVSDQLKTEIAEAIGSDKYAAYSFPFLTNYCGKWIRHCGWYPAPKVRLWDTTKGFMNLDKVHEGWVLNDPQDAIGRLKGDMLHYSFPTIGTHLKKIEQYSEYGARFDVARGKKVSFVKLILAPKLEFLKGFIIKLGFLDGYYGYVICRNSAFASWAKYLKIRQYTAFQKKGIPF